MVNVPPCYDFVQLADRTIIVTGFFTYRHRLFWTTRITSGFLIQKIPPVQKNRGWWFMSTGFVTWFDFCTHMTMNGASKTQTVIFHRSFHQSFVVCKGEKSPLKQKRGFAPKCMRNLFHHPLCNGNSDKRNNIILWVFTKWIHKHHKILHKKDIWLSWEDAL